MTAGASPPSRRNSDTISETMDRSLERVCGLGFTAEFSLSKNKNDPPSAVAERGALGWPKPGLLKCAQGPCRSPGDAITLRRHWYPRQPVIDAEVETLLKFTADAQELGCGVNKSPMVVAHATCNPANGDVGITLAEVQH